MGDGELGFEGKHAGSIISFSQNGGSGYWGTKTFFVICWYKRDWLWSFMSENLELWQVWPQAHFSSKCHLLILTWHAENGRSFLRNHFVLHYFWAQTKQYFLLFIFFTFVIRRIEYSGALLWPPAYWICEYGPSCEKTKLLRQNLHLATCECLGAHAEVESLPD